MNCNIQCGLGVAFFVASLTVMIKEKNNIKEKFYHSLTEGQKKIYREIKKERFQIWAKASGMGIFLSFLYRMNSPKISDPIKSMCVHTMIYFVTQYLVYMIHPKKLWMLNHMKNQNQVDLWLEHYKSMKKKWHYGLVLGLIGYMYLCYIIEKMSKIGNNSLGLKNFGDIPMVIELM
tara:strand:+ start:1315 stop:1842 length:528 start_codon:yes stop_codon:yes gene_type:complete